MTLGQVRIEIPARTEERLLPSALRAVRQAAAHAQLHARDSLNVHLTVVADRCADRTAVVAAEYADEVITVDAGSVGAARAAGFADILKPLAATASADAVLLSTDADSQVPRTWLSEHLRHIHAGADAVAGTVSVRDWVGRSAALQQRYERTYAAAATHVHGANLSVKAAAYRAVGGFAALAVGEDQDLVDRILAAGMAVKFRDLPTVVTSSRVESRVAQGFGDYLNTLEAAS